MNPDSQPTPPESDFESRITALLLGELSATQAAEVRAALASSPELQSLHDNLQATIGLLHEAIRHPEDSDDSLPPIERLHLSANRRETLLRSLREAPIVSLPKTPSPLWRWTVPMGIAAGLVSMLGWFELQQRTPSLMFAKQDSAFGEPLFGNSHPSEGFQLLSRGLSESTVITNSKTWQDYYTDASRDLFVRDRTPSSNAQDPLIKNATELGSVAQNRTAGFERGETRSRQSASRFGSQPPKPAAPPPSPLGDLELSLSAPAGDKTLNFFFESAPPVDFSAVSDAKATAHKDVLAGLRFGLWSARQVSSEGEPLIESLAAKPMDPAISEESLVSEAVRLEESREKAPVDVESKLTLSRELNRELQTELDLQVDTPSLRTVTEDSGSSRPIIAKLDDSARTTDDLLSAAEPLARIIASTDRLRAVVPNRPVEPPKAQPEILTTTQAHSTFSLNVTDVSFQLASVSLQKGSLPDPATIRVEEFLNAFQYHDPEPAPGVPIGFTWERAVSPFAHNREFLRFAIRTGTRGREAARPLHVVMLLDNSGSMERADRAQVVRHALSTISRQLKAEDRLSVVTFARTPQLRLEAVSGEQISELPTQLGGQTPEGGTNLEEALKLAYATASRHFIAAGNNRVVLLTDGAANLGDVLPESLKTNVESWRQRGIALDCFGIGWEGLNDRLLETLARHGDGRYGFLNSPDDADTTFATQLLGALQVAASDVKVQVEFHPQRVSLWRQIGYARHQLTQQQFRDNTVDAAELAASESGNSLYVVQVNPNGSGPMATVRVRFRSPDTQQYREHAWIVPYVGAAPSLDQTPPRMRLAACAATFGEWLAGTEFATEVTTDRLLALLRDVPTAFAPDPTPKRLELMIRQAKSNSGR